MTRSYSPYSWIFILLSFVVIISVVVIKGRNAKDGKLLEVVSLGSLSQSINDFHVYRLNNEDIKMEIKAESAIVRNGDEDASIRGIEITYNPHGNRPIKLYADKGKYNINKNILFVEKEYKDVDIKVGSNVTIKANSFQWTEDTKKIQSAGRVSVIGDNFSLEGDGLVADIDSGVYEIKKNIKATIW